MAYEFRILNCSSYVCSFVLCAEQKTAHELRISDWSTAVCASDLVRIRRRLFHDLPAEWQRIGVPRHLPRHARRPGRCNSDKKVRCRPADWNAVDPSTGLWTGRHKTGS